MTYLATGRDGYYTKDFSYGRIRDDYPGAIFYFYPERILLTGKGGSKNTGSHMSGMGTWGMDYWPVLIDGNTKPIELIQRYVQTTGFGGFFVGPGKNGPVPTRRLYLMKEGLQDAEARVYIQNALLDQAAKLGPDLAKRCKEVCDERTRVHAICTQFGYDYYLMPAEIDTLRTKLYRMTDEVAKALGK